MQKELIGKVDSLIEQTLRIHLKNIGSGHDAILLLGEFVEYFYSNNHFSIAENFRPGLDILMPALVDNFNISEETAVVENQLEKIHEAVVFAGHYYSIRDLIYFSYAMPDSVSWEYRDDKFLIRVLDSTIFRQFVSESISFGLNSSGTFKHVDSTETISLLKGSLNWDLKDPNVQNAFERISEEVEIKMHHFFSYIPADSKVNIGGYQYKEFWEVYKILLTISMYERYFATANGISNVISYQESELSKQITMEVGFERSTVENILRDMATCSRGTFVRIPDSNKYYLLPFSFSLKDSIGAVLKQFAQRDSDSFSSECGIIIGNSLVEKVSSYFNNFRNFRIYNDIRLQKFDKLLPDIDIAAISYEPSLGFHIFIGEIKNSLPATWSKDYLKSTGKKGFIDKAISQVEKIREFIENKQEGIELLKDLCLNSFPRLKLKTLFPKGFMIVIDYLIITDQSIGMFYPDLNLNIISDDILREVINKSDGDVNFMKYCLHNLNQTLDETFETKIEEVSIGNCTICYESAFLKGFLTIPQNKYLSNNSFEEMEQTSLETGYTFLDTNLEQYIARSKENENNKPNRNDKPY